jgi:hypothetical protein
MLKIIFKKKFIMVYLNNKIFLQQEYIRNKQYTYMYILHWLNKYGYNIKDKNN